MIARILNILALLFIPETTPVGLEHWTRIMRRRNAMRDRWQVRPEPSARPPASTCTTGTCARCVAGKVQP